MNLVKTYIDIFDDMLDNTIYLNSTDDSYSNQTVYLPSILEYDLVNHYDQIYETLEDASNEFYKDLVNGIIKVVLHNINIRHNTLIIRDSYRRPVLTVSNGSSIGDCKRISLMWLMNVYTDLKGRYL